MSTDPSAVRPGFVKSGALKARDNVVVVYSLGGHSQRLARQVADLLGADIFLIRTERYRWPVFGVLRAAYDAIRGNLPEVRCNVEQLSKYRCLVVGGPIWGGKLAAPVTAFLEAQPDLPQALGLFVTCGGMAPPDAAVKATEARLGRGLSALMWLPNKLENTDEMTRRLAEFRADLEKVIKDSPASA
ncbi:MAG: hypothetical protein HKP40_00305 [Litoreibacter sp.]|nr:hypothetical protein [Litoreibacter sp.]